jgi:hypothetical protein
MIQRRANAMPRALLLVITGALAGPLTLGRAAADRDAVDAARVDWAAGQITAGGTGIADRHAPSPAIALGTSRRGAEDVARRRIRSALGALPLATGGTLAQKLVDRALEARLDAAVSAALTVAADPETDGSWHVTLAVPLEAIRIALTMPRPLPPGGDRGPPVVVIDGVTAVPAIGWTIGGVAGAVIWVPSVPGWAKDAPRTRARASASGAIEVAANPGTAATLYVLVARER